MFNFTATCSYFSCPQELHCFIQFILFIENLWLCWVFLLCEHAHGHTSKNVFSFFFKYWQNAQNHVQNWSSQIKFRLHSFYPLTISQVKLGYTEVEAHREASQLTGTVQPLWASIQLNHPISAAVIYQPIRQVDRKNITLVNKNWKSIKIDQYKKITHKLYNWQ